MKFCGDIDHSFTILNLFKPLLIIMLSHYRIHYLSAFFPNSFKTEIAEFTVSSCFKLAEICLEKLHFRDDIDLICLAIKLLFSSMQLWRNVTIDSQSDDKENKIQEKESQECIRKLSRKLGSKLKVTLDIYMPDNYQSVALSSELKVRIV